MRNLRYQPSKTGAQKLLAEKLRDEKISYGTNGGRVGSRSLLRVPVEIDGFYHLSAGQQAKDRQKDQRLQAAGYHVLRFTNSQIYQDSKACLHKIRAFIDGHDLQLKIGARPDDEQAPWQSKLAALKKKLDQEEE